MIAQRNRTRGVCPVREGGIIMARKDTKTINYIPVFVLTAIIVVACFVSAFSISGIGTASADDAPNAGTTETEVVVQEEPTTDGGEAVTATVEAVQNEGSAGTGSTEAADLQPADDCTVTINYYEAVTYEDPDVEVDNTNRRLLGSRTINGLHEGEVLNAWDYVVDLPGHFFFDGWPLELTVSRDPAQNVMDLMYVKLWDSEYTVNYYVMVGADLGADTWAEALAPEDVEFYKMGSQTFDNQRFDALIKGDAYEYKLDDMYVIDTYPAQIRLGTDPDNNVINVLYTPDLTTLPDDIEVPDGIIPPADDGSGDSGDNGSGDTGSGDNGNNGSGDSGSSGSGSGTPTLPGDTTVDKDDMESMLPDIGGGGSSDDFLGSDADRGELDVTDEMLENPVNKEQAEKTIEAYKTGLQAGSLAQTGEGFPIVAVVSASIAVVALIVLVSYILVNRRKMKASEEK